MIDFDRAVIPVLLLAASVIVIWLSDRHLRALPARTSSRWLRVCDLMVLFVVVTVSAGLAASSTINALASMRFRAIHPPHGSVYLVNGRSMHLDCTGSGAPTIVLDAGLGNDSLVWGGIQPALSATTRVCSYDRAGFGWSDAAPAPRDADHIAAELHQLLSEARIDGPIVLMGHSIAGIYIRDYAAHYPQQVAGLVFVDGSTPLQNRNPALQAAAGTGLPPWASGLMQRAISIAGLPRIAGACAHATPGFDPHAALLLAEDLCLPQFGAVQQELKAFDASGQETIRTGPFGALPVLIFSQDPARILSAPNSNPQARDFAMAWNSMQEDLKNLSTRSRRIIAKGSSHYVLIDRADLIRREIPLFIAQLRGLAPERADYGTTVTE